MLKTFILLLAWTQHFWSSWALVLSPSLQASPSLWPAFGSGRATPPTSRVQPGVRALGAAPTEVLRNLLQSKQAGLSKSWMVPAKYSSLLAAWGLGAFALSSVAWWCWAAVTSPGSTAICRGNVSLYPRLTSSRESRFFFIANGIKKQVPTQGIALKLPFRTLTKRVCCAAVSTQGLHWGHW